MSAQLPRNGILSKGKTVLLVFLFALVIRIVFISTLQDGYYFSDSARYEEATRHIVLEGEFPREYDRAPLYPAFLAMQYATVGDEILKTRVIQSVMGAVVAALLVLIGLRTGGYWVGVTAGLLWSIYPMGVFIAGTVYPASLLAILVALGVFCLVPGKDRAVGLVAISCSGFLFGLAALAKPVVVAAIAVIAAWLLVFRNERRVLGPTLFVLAAVLALTPWTVRNYQVFGKLVPIEARGLDSVVPWTKTEEELIRELLVKRALLSAIEEEKKAGELEEGEVYRALAEKLEEPKTEEETASFLAPPPARSKSVTDMLKGMAVRFPREFISFFELYPRRVGFLNQRQRDKARAWKNPRLVEKIPFGNSAVNAVSAFAVSFLYIFALLGIRAMWLTASVRQYMWLYLGIVLSFAAGYAMSWGKIRYRVPVDPYIILLSAWGVFWAWGAVFGWQEDPADDAGNTVQDRAMDQAATN